MLSWLPGAERVEADKSGGTYDPSFPWRIVLHTTEGGSVDGAIVAYRNHGSWPQLTVDPVKRRVVQHYPFNLAGRALLHPSNTIATNGARAIQIEIVCYADSQLAKQNKGTYVGDLSSDQVEWLGRVVLAPIMEAFDIPAVMPPFWPAYPSSYGAKAGQRIRTDAAWQAFHGICAHMHVINNLHGDCGALDIGAVVRAAGTALSDKHAAPPPANEEDDVKNMFYVKRADQSEVYLASLGERSNYVPHFGLPERAAYGLGIRIVSLAVGGDIHDVTDSKGQKRAVWHLDDDGAKMFDLPVPPQH